MEALDRLEARVSLAARVLHYRPRALLRHFQSAQA